MKKHILSLDRVTSGLQTGAHLFAEKVALLEALEEKPIVKQDLTFLVASRNRMNESLVIFALESLLNGNYLALREEGVIDFQTAMHKIHWKNKAISSTIKLTLKQNNDQT